LTTGDPKREFEKRRMKNGTSLLDEVIADLNKMADFLR